MVFIDDEEKGINEGESANDVDSNEQGQEQASSENSDSLQNDESSEDKVTESQTTDQQPNKEALIAELLQSDEVQRVIQSKTDKGIAQSEQRRRDEDRRVTEVKAREAAKQEIMDALSSDDEDVKKEKLAELGQKKVDDMLEEEQMTKAAAKFSSYYEDSLNNNPEFAEKLGTDKVKEISDEVQREGGSVLDFANRLHTAVADKRVDDAVSDAKTSIKEEILEEMKTSRESEAQELEQKVDERSQEAEDGKSVQKSVEQGSIPKKPNKDYTDEEASKLYGDGEMSGEEFEPYRLAHKRKQR